MKYIQTISSAYIVLVLLQGCVHMPRSESADSGMDDHKTFLPSEPDKRDVSLHDLRLDWESQKHQLNILILRGAKLCFPASVVIAKRREQRILNELLGGMYLDAANDILIQRKNLVVLERQVSYTNKYDTCLPQPLEIIPAKPALPSGGGDLGEESINRIMQLLNSDNQFARNSPKINPKFKFRLQHTADELRDYANYVLVISGHTDESGSDVSNRYLSLLRANNVSDFLVGQGIESKRIIVRALGEEDPLYEGDDDATYLVNRRVHIQILRKHDILEDK